MYVIPIISFVLLTTLLIGIYVVELADSALVVFTTTIGIAILIWIEVNLRPGR